jgi:hypothetical protein
MFFFRKDEPGLAICFRDKDGGTMLGLSFVVAVEFRKDCTMSSTLTAVLCRSLRNVRDMYRSRGPLGLLVTIMSYRRC